MSRTQRVIAKIDDIELEFQNKEEVLETDMLTFEYNIIFFKKKLVQFQIPLPNYFHTRLSKRGEQ